MRFPIVLAAALAAFAGGACAAETYESYDAFYVARPGAVFGDAIKSKPGVAYSSPGEQGVYTELRAILEGRAVNITLAGNRITIDGKTYRYASAATFPGEHPSNIYPLTADVFLAGRTSAHPAVLCLQGGSNGSGESDRYTQIYLLINPLAPKRKVTFPHLPSLLSSCRAVLETKDGKLAFPKNSYLLDDAQESRVGLLVSYYAFEDRRFAPVRNEIRLRFTHPEVPFQFSIQDK
ncbi:hypothetical protein [Trinickia mobilis]|uniref:hypothetical protein n=1 Tax=Trinickia mobilis TaxID=2816356 RepID=UPI001A8F264D|nr:hypothetical protein [Trinickia mobilis]